MVPPLVLDADVHGRVRRIVIDPGAPVILGRTEGADVVLRSATVARRHAWLRHDAGRWTVEDAGSHCGTQVNDALTLANRVQLCVGDRVRLGQVVLTVVDGAPPPEAGRVAHPLDRSAREPPPTNVRGTLRIRDDAAWSAPDGYVRNLLDRIGHELEDDRASLEILRDARRGGTADLRGLDPAPFQRVLAAVERACLHQIITGVVPGQGQLVRTVGDQDPAGLADLLTLLRADDRARGRPLPTLAEWERGGLARVLADGRRETPGLLEVLVGDPAWLVAAKGGEALR